MKTMIVGGGGREHALAMASHEAGSELLFTQPNAGMDKMGQRLPISWVPSAGFRDLALADVAVQYEVDLAIIGPEAPLAMGLADRFRERGIATLGFGLEAAKLESSKIFANDFMEQYGILKPATVTANKLEDGLLFVKGRKAEDYVIKVDGLAGGKGVILPDSKQQARRELIDMMSGETFGEAGQRVLFQERLHGEEVSMMVLFDGRNAEVLFLAQDYKRLEDKDKGPNTGGMGSYAPVPPEIASVRQVNQMYDSLEKTLYGLRDRDISDPGVIYLGFMLAEEFGGDPAVMEYNVRFGDPEAQAGLTMLEDAGNGVHDLIDAAAHGSLGAETETGTIFTTGQVGRAALTVCLASPGYPDAPRTGAPIYGLNQKYPETVVHHGGTKYCEDEGARVFTAGGRVLYVTGIGETLAQAADTAYGAIEDDGLYFDNMQYRSDIGRRAVKAVKRGAR